MKPSIITISILLVAAAGQANAACTDPQITDPNVLTSLLLNNTVCGTRGTDKWQEEHLGVSPNSPGTINDLMDYKEGPNDEIDPSKVVGTWKIETINNNTVVTYAYSDGGTAGPYSYTVHDKGGGGYSFCGTTAASEDIDVTIIPVLSGCP